jgi:hypothetical protein
VQAIVPPNDCPSNCFVIQRAAGWNDASEPIAVVHSRYPDASEEVLAFRTFMASIFPADVTANYQREGLDTVATTAARPQRVAGQSASRLRTTTITPDAATGVSLAADKSCRIHRNVSAASQNDCYSYEWLR